MSGSRGPLSKNPEQRRRRNLPPAKTQLPAEGYQGDIPEWPLLEQTEYERMKWDWLWRTPMAAEWARMNIEPVLARYVRISIEAECAETRGSVAQSNIKGEARQLETLLGLNPSALKRLEWQVPEEQDAEVVNVTAAPRRRLRAVDPDAS